MPTVKLFDEPPEREPGVHGWPAMDPLPLIRDTLKRNPGKWAVMPNVDDSPMRRYLNRATSINTQYARDPAKYRPNSVWRGFRAVIRHQTVYLTFSPDTPVE